MTPSDVVAATDDERQASGSVEDDLRQQAAAFRAIAERAPDIITRIDRNLRYSYVNPAVTRVGGSPDLLLGRPLRGAATPDAPVNDRQAVVLRVFETGEEQVVEQPFVTPHGLRYFQIRYVPERDPNGAIEHVLSYARDVTERVRADEALRLLAEAGDALGASLEYEATLAGVAQLLVPRLGDWCSVQVVDERGQPSELALAHVDPAKVEWVRELQQRFPEDYSEGSTIMRVLRSREAMIIPEVTDEMLVAGAKSPEHLAAFRQIGFRSIIIAPLVARERALGVITLVMAESDRRYGDADVALARELARRAALAVDNARLFREAQRAAQAREEFLSIAAHELKTPLTTIKASAQLLTRRASRPEVDADAIATLTRQVEAQVSRLEGLVNDLLDVSRVQADALPERLEWSDLRALAQAVHERAQTFPERTALHQLVFDAPEPIEGWWDAARLDQVATNLLSNALKYSPAGGEVALTLRRDEDAAVLVVRDQGVGIAPEAQAELFRPFARGDAGEHGIPGTGLGLYIAARIVERCGGTIAVESVPGAGSAFTVRLPIRGEQGTGNREQ